MEHPPTSSSLEDSARKFKLALAAVIDGPLPGLDPHLARVLEATAAEVIAQARSMHARAVDAESGFPCIAERDATIESLRQRCEEANRLMTAYRVKAHALDRELDATRERLSKSRASHKKIIAERDATIAKLESIFDEAESLGERRGRSSIVTFLRSLASAFSAGTERELTITLAAQIERGDDRQGGQ